MEDPMELHEAASMGDRRLLEGLLKEGQYYVDSEDWTFEKRTPLHVAIESGKLNCVRILLSYGADPGARTRSGQTPAHMAAERGDIKCLQMLMGYDAPIDLEDNSGVTPLKVARIYAKRKCAEFLETVLQSLKDKKETLEVQKERNMNGSSDKIMKVKNTI